MLYERVCCECVTLNLTMLYVERNYERRLGDTIHSCFQVCISFLLLLSPQRETSLQMQYFPKEGSLDKMYFPYYGKNLHVSSLLSRTNTAHSY